jgi:hypothetical protein
MKATAYQIKVHYQTGNSFGSEDTDGIIDLEWTNLESAKKNLARIKEHYEQYKVCNSYQNKGSCEDRYKENESKDWFVKNLKPAVKYGERPNDYNAIDESQIDKCKKLGKEIIYFYDNFYAQNCIILYTDDNKPVQMSCFWCGYFEQLHSAEIITQPEDGLRIEF